MKKILITGSTGLLGQGLITNAPHEYQIYAASSKKYNHLHNSIIPVTFDITNYSEVRGIIDKVVPDVVIHAASIGSVDFCERQRNICKLVNVDGTKHLVNACKKISSHFIYLSSNAIFDGKNPPYSELSATNPVNYYGTTKLAGETLINSSGLNATIVRPVLMFGWNLSSQRKNPATWIIDELRNDKTVRLVSDVFNNPVLNTDVARVIWEIIANKQLGIFHVAGYDRVSRYEFGLAVAKVFGLNSKLITSVTSNYFPEIAPRMPDTTYDTSYIKKMLGFSPRPLLEALELMKNTEIIVT